MRSYISAIVYTATLAPPIMGLPLQSGSPLPVRLMMYALTAILVYCSVFVRPGPGKLAALAAAAVVCLSVLGALILNLACFDAVIAHDGMAFATHLVGASAGSVRSAFVVLLSVFVMAL